MENIQNQAVEPQIGKQCRDSFMDKYPSSWQLEQSHLVDGIVTRPLAGDARFESRQGQDIFIYFTSLGQIWGQPILSFSVQCGYCPMRKQVNHKYYQSLFSNKVSVWSCTAVPSVDLHTAWGGTETEIHLK